MKRIEKSIKTIVYALSALLLSSSFVEFHALAGPCDLTQVPYCTWAGTNTFGFFGAGDTGSIINFETLPDGTPSFGGVNITPAFNYVLQGALFTSPFPGLKVVGNSQIGFGLEAYTSNLLAHNWITAELSQPQRGVRVIAFGHTTLFAYDAQGGLITSVSYFIPNVEFFLAIKSNIPISRVVIDRNSNEATLDDFTMIHIPVPEPAYAALLLFVASTMIRRPRRDGRWKN